MKEAQSVQKNDFDCSLKYVESQIFNQQFEFPEGPKKAFWVCPVSRNMRITNFFFHYP